MYGVAPKRLHVVEESCTESEKSDAPTESDAESFSEEEAHLLSEIQKFLPVHLRCGAHTLSLCATSDAAKLLINSL